jgi:transcriptional activator protein UGA3
LLPLAVESSTLLAALIALASGNLSNFNKTYRLAALEARSQALVALGKTVANPLEDIHECESALASCLILSTSEAILGQRSGWSEHLIGAKMIVQTARVSNHDGLLLTGPDAFKTSPEGEWLLRNFAYHDILGSVTTRRPPLISGLYLRSMADVVDSYMGVHLEVLVFISQISSLDFNIAHAEDVLIQLPLGFLAGGSTKIFNLGNTWNSCYSLEQDIRAWQPRGLDPILNSMALAYKGSALVYLYQRMRQYLRDACIDSEVQHRLSHIRTMISIEVTQILDSIMHIPSGADAECIMLFPLFMAGGEAIHPSDMETVRARLRLIDETRGFRNIQRASEVLEEVWAASLASADTRQVDWYDVLERQGGGLLLT